MAEMIFAPLRWSGTFMWPLRADGRSRSQTGGLSYFCFSTNPVRCCKDKVLPILLFEHLSFLLSKDPCIYVCIYKEMMIMPIMMLMTMTMTMMTATMTMIIIIGSTRSPTFA